MNLYFDINIGGWLELLDSSVLYAEEMVLELGFGNTSYTRIYINKMYHDAWWKCDLIVMMLCRVSPGQTWHSGAALICFRSEEREVLGSIPGRDIPKSLKMELAAPRLVLRFTG